MSVSLYVGILRVPCLNTDTQLSILTLNVEVNIREDSSGDAMKRTLHVSLSVFPLCLIIKMCVDQTRGSYQIRPGKANYTDNNLSLYCCRHVSPYKATNTWNTTSGEEGHWGEIGHLNAQTIFETDWLLGYTVGRKVVNVLGICKFWYLLAVNWISYKILLISVRKL